MKAPIMASKPLPVEDFQDNTEFHRERSEFHKRQIRKRLNALGFNEHAQITLTPENPAAVPLAFVTGVNAEKFDPDKHLMTDTKTAVAVGNNQYLLNQSAAFVAVLLDESDHEIVMQVKPDAVEKVQSIFSTLPGYERLHIIPVPTDDKSLTSKFYQAASGISEEKPIARVDLALYEILRRRSGPAVQADLRRRPRRGGQRRRQARDVLSQHVHDRL